MQMFSSTKSETTKTTTIMMMMIMIIIIIIIIIIPSLDNKPSHNISIRKNSEIRI